ADEVDLKAEVEREIASGIKPNQAIKEDAKRYQLKKQEVYDSYHGLG
ncbi:16S rRNA (cytidine(1402)-2'-O)-methyltransferase, partial [Streptococcus suis]